LTHSVLRFLVWLIWCCTARWSLFHKSYRRSCYASGLYSKAELLFVSITSSLHLCSINFFQNSSIYASCQLFAKRFLDPDQVAPRQGPRKILVNIALNSASPASRRPAAPSKLQQEHLGNRIGNSCQNRQRLELSWSSSSRMRT
ncbi:hypothetical protein P692DRAFT_20738184, partial [Suillus brevipes Sb2]